MQLDKQYKDLCAQAGDLQYKILTMQNELNEVNGRIKALNQLNYDLKQQASAEAAKHVQTQKTPKTPPVDNV